MIVVSDNRHQPEFPCQIMYELKSRPRAVAPVQEIPEIDKGIDRPKARRKCRVPDIRCDKAESIRISMYIGKDYRAHKSADGYWSFILI
jgi:hypothetical protein